MREVVSTKTAPGAIGPYNQAIIAQGKMVFTAGQIPLHPESGELVGETVEEQTVQSLKNLEAVVTAAGSSLANVIKTTVFLKDMNDFLKMNEVYSTFFNNNPPARSAVEVSRLPKDVLVEIECIALVS